MLPDAAVLPGSSGPRPRITVVGSSNTDFVIRAPRIPKPGETVLGGAFYRAGGGKGANQAVAAARLGAEVTLVARVGDDDLGRAAKAAYEAEGLCTDFVRTDPDAASAVGLIVVDRDGENAIAVAPGANANLSVEDVERADTAIEASDVLLLQLETPWSASARAIELARGAVVRVILNPAPAGPVPPELLPYIDVLTPNEPEAVEMASLVRATGPHGPPDVERAALELVESGVGAVVVTLGARGAALATADTFRRFPAPRVEAVDTTGAGDAFNGALAVALAEGSDLPEAIEFAQRCAAMSVEREGAQPSLPVRADL